MRRDAEGTSFIVSVSLAELVLLLFFVLLLAAVVRLAQKERELEQERADRTRVEKTASLLRERIDLAKEQVASEADLTDDAFFELVRRALGQGDESLRSQLVDALAAAEDEAAARARAEASAGRLEAVLEEERAARASAASANEDLRGQLAAYEDRFGHGGRDHPPCWARPDTGRVEYLLSITIREDGLLVEPAWPGDREQPAHALPGVEAMLGSLSLDEFGSRADEVLAWSDAQEPPCRHYVRVADRTATKETFKRSLLTIERYFYKYLEREG